MAADGIHSATRAALFPGHPGASYSGFTSWRMVVPGPGPGLPFAPHETWGAGAVWGTRPLPDGRVYAYAAALAPPGERTLYPDGEKGELLRRFGGWHDPVPALLRAVEPGQVPRTDLHHLLHPLPALRRGRTALLGDAAHAMTPFLGQGGNQAVEDAVVPAHRAAPGARWPQRSAPTPPTGSAGPPRWSAGRPAPGGRSPSTAVRRSPCATCPSPPSPASPPPSRCAPSRPSPPGAPDGLSPPSAAGASGAPPAEETFAPGVPAEGSRGGGAPVECRACVTHTTP